MPLQRLGVPTSSVFLEGVPLWVYGSSFTTDPGAACTPGLEFFKLVQARLRMTSVTTYGSSGKSIRDASKRVVGGLGVAGAPWTTARKGVAIIDTWVNDLSAYQNVAGDYTPRAFVAKDISGIKGNLAAALAYMSAGTILENTVGTKGGTWAADGAANDRSGGNNSISSTAGATMTWTGVSIPEDHFFFLGHVLEPTSFSLAPIEVLVDGVVKRTITVAELQCHSSVEGAVITTGNAAFRVNTTPGTHTIVVRHAGTTGQNMLVDALIVPRPVAARSPIFVVQDQIPRGVVGGAYFRPDDIATLQTNWPQLLAAYQAVVAEFPNAVFVTTTLDNAVHYGADGIHPNDRGMLRKADELVDAISSRLASSRPDNLYAII